MAHVPTIKTIQLKEYESKQSKYNHCSKLPMRALMCGPSGSGKTILLVNMVLDIYKDCFFCLESISSRLAFILTIVGTR